MYIIKLNAIESTNNHLKEMVSVTLPKDYTVIVADSQSKGRGQMGAKWQSESGKNLTVSVFKAMVNIKIEEQFYVSMVISLAIYKALSLFKIPQLHVKWPNDILSADKKICGILIENVIKNNKFLGSIVGFGLNINQKYFENLPQASSMSLLTGILYDRDEVLSHILKQLEVYFKLLEDHKFADLKTEYEALLFRKEKPSTFKTESQETFTGIIKGVTENGKLKVCVEDSIIKTFDLKEIKLLY